MKNCCKPFALAAFAAATAFSLRPAAAQPMPETMEFKERIGQNFDKLFMLHSAMTNMAEVKLGGLALKKSRNADVRKVAMTTMKEHGMAQKDLAKHFKAMNMAMPKNPGVANMATYEKLSKMSGSAFDKAYIGAQMGGHEQAVTLFSHESHMGKNATAKAFANNKLPSILGHTAMIYVVAKKLKVPGAELRPAPVAAQAPAAAREHEMHMKMMMNMKMKPKAMPMGDSMPMDNGAETDMGAGMNNKGAG